MKEKKQPAKGQIGSPEFEKFMALVEEKCGERPKIVRSKSITWPKNYQGKSWWELN